MAGIPVVVMAGLCAMVATYSLYLGADWADVWGRAMLSFSHFLMLDAVLIAWTFWREEPKPDKVTDKDQPAEGDPVRAISGIVLVLLYLLWSTCSWLGYGAENRVTTINLVFGGLSFVAFYLLRERLLIEPQGTAAEEAQNAGAQLIWSTPGRDPWALALLKHLSGTIVWALCNAGVTVFLCTMVIISSFERHFQVDEILGVIAGAAILNLCMAWVAWIPELKAWRALPLSRMQFGGAVVALTVASCVLPWTLVFTGGVLIHVALGYFSGNALLSLLGASLAIQGALLPVLPAIMRGFRGGLRPWLLIALVLASIGCISFSVRLSVWLKFLTQTNLTTHGWTWMAVGTAVLCAGMVLSAWHAERVLRHGDCYGKAGE